ncbi:MULTISPECIES: hypothetical protein [Clostridium]|uniref:hypothetical protein n=1 Tax=Clostridium sp. TaxID=1506 RepID=UPI000564A3EE|nr:MULTISPECIES: hypothetical protein [Clostridium]MDF2502749.1 hypothetical protein [Clostridium sp.]
MEVIKLTRKHNRLTKKRWGIIIASIGAGIIITFIIPVWGWIMAVGAGLIYCGWSLINHSHDH